MTYNISSIRIRGLKEKKRKTKKSHYTEDL